jgi:transposase
MVAGVSGAVAEVWSSENESAARRSPSSDTSGLPCDRGQQKLPTCGQINPHPSDRPLTVRCSCAVDGREERVEEGKGAGGDRRPLYEELGSYRAVAALVGCDHTTVKRYVELAGELGQLAPTRRRARITDEYRGLFAERVEQTRGRITARRLWRLLRAAGCEGSERSLRRAVAAEKRGFREREAREGRVFRPWRSGPGEWLVCDWGRPVETPAGSRPLSFFGSVLGYSRHRQLTFSCSERFPALAMGLAANLQQLGGVPAKIPFDNPKTVTLRDVAGAAVLNPELVRLAAHYRFRPQTTAFYDAPSKGTAEALVRFTKSDLIPYGGFGSLDEANAAARLACRVKLPAALGDQAPAGRVVRAGAPAAALAAGAAADGRLRRGAQGRPALDGALRFGSLLSAAPPGRQVGRGGGHRSRAHGALRGRAGCPPSAARTGRVLDRGRPLSEPATDGNAAAQGAHRARAGVPRARRGGRVLPAGGGAQGTARLDERIDDALCLAATSGKQRAREALSRATRFGRFARGDLEAISDWLGATPPAEAAAAQQLRLEGLPEIPSRSIDAYRRDRDGPSRLTESSEAEAAPGRELAPDLLQTARTQRWPPEKLLATLVREEIAARERSNLARRLKAAGFPGHKTLDGFRPDLSQLPRPTFEFLRSREWLERKDNLCLAGPAGTGKSHLSEALARAACEAGHRVRFFSADELVEALYRGLADNPSAG